MIEHHPVMRATPEEMAHQIVDEVLRVYGNKPLIPRITEEMLRYVDFMFDRDLGKEKYDYKAEFCAGGTLTLKIWEREPMTLSIEDVKAYPPQTPPKIERKRVYVRSHGVAGAMYVSAGDMLEALRDWRTPPDLMNGEAYGYERAVADVINFLHQRQKRGHRP